MSIIKVENITKHYGRQLVLDQVSFSVEEPKILALIGPNGAGKSTLLSIITNLLQPSSGQVTIFGKPNSDSAIFREISFMQDNTVLYDYLTGYDHLQFIADMQGLSKESIVKVAQMIGNESYLHKKVKSYSLGMKQHLLLAMAVINQPKLLILDEPLNGLDPSSAIRVRELLLHLYNDRGTTILLSSHNLGEIDRITTDILFLKDGKLIEEDLSQFTEVVYYLSVPIAAEGMNVLQRNGIPVTAERERLILAMKEIPIELEEIFMLLGRAGIPILDIEKRVTGAEERYRQIFGHLGGQYETV